MIEEIDTDHAPKKPDFHMMERSPMLLKAKCFKEMLQKDNERLQQMVAAGKGDEVSIEVLNEHDTEEISMNLMMGLCESQTPTVLPPDTTEMPAGTWHSASSEPK